METADIIQIVSLSLTVLGFVASELLALCPDTQANGLVHWLKLYAAQFEKTNETGVTVNAPGGTYIIQRRRTIKETPGTPAHEPPTSSRTDSVYSKIAVQNDVPGQD